MKIFLTLISICFSAIFSFAQSQDPFLEALKSHGIVQLYGYQMVSEEMAVITAKVGKGSAYQPSRTFVVTIDSENAPAEVMQLDLSHMESYNASNDNFILLDGVLSRIYYKKNKKQMEIWKDRVEGNKFVQDPQPIYSKAFTHSGIDISKVGNFYRMLLIPSGGGDKMEYLILNKQFEVVGKNELMFTDAVIFGSFNWSTRYSSFVYGDKELFFPRLVKDRKYSSEMHYFNGKELTRISFPEEIAGSIIGFQHLNYENKQELILITEENNNLNFFLCNVDEMAKRLDVKDQKTISASQLCEIKGFTERNLKEVYRNTLSLEGYNFPIGQGKIGVVDEILKISTEKYTAFRLQGYFVFKTNQTGFEWLKYIYNPGDYTSSMKQEEKELIIKTTVQQGKVDENGNFRPDQRLLLKFVPETIVIQPDGSYERTLSPAAD